MNKVANIIAGICIGYLLARLFIVVIVALRWDEKFFDWLNGGTQRGRDDDAPPATETQSRPSLK